MSYRWVTWPALASAGPPGRTLTKGARLTKWPPPRPVRPRPSVTLGPRRLDAQAAAKLGAPGRPPHRARADPSEGAFRHAGRERKLLFDKRKIQLPRELPRTFSTLTR